MITQVFVVGSCTMSRITDIGEAMRSSLTALGRSGSVSVLPDYFVDRLVKIESIDELISAIKKKSLEGGGGSIRGVSQAEVKGGNAVNLGYALGKFGARVNLLAIAESLPAETLRSTFQAFPNVKLIIVPGRNGFTIALEFFEHGRHVNVMVSDTGDLGRFDGSAIDRDTLESISAARIVALVNWAANEGGNELCSKVFSSAKKQGALTFLDPADVARLSRNIPELKEKVFDKGLVDYMSLNDNELRIFCKVLLSHSLPQDYSRVDLERAVRLLSDVSHARVDLHTRSLSISCRSNDCLVVNCHKVNQKIVTGAGDVWDAGDIVGYLLGWKVEWRLRFANAAAGLYVSNEDAEPPTLEDVLRFISTHEEFYH
jgi:ribokinase